MAVLDYEQFKGKPFQVVSKLGVRYTGIFDHISQEDQTICLAQVFNHGTEDRPTQRKLPGSSTTLGWVRFHTESIESLALVENYLAPGQEAPVDPILASVSQTAPASVQNPTAAKSRSQPPAPSVPPPASTSQPSYDLPRKPSNAAQSAAKALDRVQKSLSELAVDGPRAQLQPSRRNQPPNARQPEVPDAEFDFSKGTERFEAEREARVVIKGKEKSEDGESQETSEAGTPLEPSQPGRSMSNGSGSALEMGGGKSSTAYSKNSFFDGLSGGSSRISRADERHRNFDTFGEAGGDGYDRGRGGFGGRGGYGGAAGGSGEYGGRGGFGGRGGAGQGYGGQSMGFGRGGSGGGPPRGGFDGPQRGFVNGNGVGGGYRGRGGRGGFGQARAELQPQ